MEDGKTPGAYLSPLGDSNGISQPQVSTNHSIYGAAHTHTYARFGLKLGPSLSGTDTYYSNESWYIEAAHRGGHPTAPYDSRLTLTACLPAWLRATCVDEQDRKHTATPGRPSPTL